MRLSEIKMLKNVELIYEQSTQSPKLFDCFVTFMGGIVQKGVVYATDRTAAIIKNYQVLSDQGVLDIVEGIDCCEHNTMFSESKNSN